MMMEARCPSVGTCAPDGHPHQRGYEAVSPTVKKTQKDVNYMINQYAK